MKLVGLTGLPRAGKDTAARWLYAKYGYSRLSFAAPLKQAAAVLLAREPWEMNGEQGFDREAILPEWGFSTRWFLQRFGTECMRQQIREDFWIQRMRNAIKSAGPRVVISDCRFENEGAMVRELGGVIIRVVRPGIAASSHVSDAGISYDTTIANNGSEDELLKEVDLLVENFELA